MEGTGTVFPAVRYDHYQKPIVCSVLLLFSDAIQTFEEPGVYSRIYGIAITRLTTM